MKRKNSKIKKKNLMPVILASLVLTSCTSNASQPQNTSSDLAFPLGNEIRSDSFTGTVYLETMIENDDIYHFPQTNHITFEPGARSSWHNHGGMIILVTGGVGIIRKKESQHRSYAREM